MPPNAVSIETQLIGKTSQEAALIKAQALANAAPGSKKLIYTQAGITYTVTGWYVDADGAFCVTATAFNASGPVPTDNLYRFFNPPIRVRDALGVLVEDPLNAVKAIVTEAVLVYARKRGWTQ